MKKKINKRGKQRPISQSYLLIGNTIIRKRHFSLFCNIPQKRVKLFYSKSCVGKSDTLYNDENVLPPCAISILIQH